MEQEMCQYLEWELNIDPITLREFEEMIHKDFVSPGPYPTYIFPSTKKSMPPSTANPFAVIRSALSIATQTGMPPQSPRWCT